MILLVKNNSRIGSISSDKLEQELSYLQRKRGAKYIRYQNTNNCPGLQITDEPGNEIVTMITPVAAIFAKFCNELLPWPQNNNGKGMELSQFFKKFLRPDHSKY